MLCLGVCARYVKDALGLQEDCTTTQIRKAYRLESLKHHPDKAS